MGELYSITGLFYESFPGISPWGGHFLRGKEGEPENQISGQLIDMYGPSTLEGIMEGEKLKFRKQYINSNREQTFDYEFVLKNGIWQGEYINFPAADYNGRSVCKTFSCLEHLNFERVDLRTPEGFAKALIDSMVENGKLEKFKDPETGEDMIRPV